MSESPTPAALDVIYDAISDTDPHFDSQAEAAMKALAAAGYSIVSTGALKRLIEVAAYVSRGRLSMLGPYPDATARIALGALPDELLDLIGEAPGA